jgi:hypothetical protein
MNRSRLALALALLPVLPLALVMACGDEETPAGPAVPDGGAPTLRGVDSSAPIDGAGSADAVGPVVDAGMPDADAALPDADAAPCPIGFDETVTGQIKVTADDYLRLWVNGALVDDKQTTWGTIDTLTVTLFRSPQRKNVIAVEARNAQNAGGFDRGLIVDLGFDAGADGGPEGGIPSVVTDLTWKIEGETTDGGAPDGGFPDGSTPNVPAWFAPDFDDSAWHPPTDEGPHGMSPWGLVFGTSSARWLWSYDSSTAGSKPTNDLVYFRKVFYLDTNGIPKDTPPACP